MSDLDTIQRFTFDNTDIRGELVGLHDALRAVLNKHAYPKPLEIELGKLMAASALLSATLKYEGRLSLQVRLSEGPVTLIQAETTDQGALRAIARYQENTPFDQVSLKGGQLVITLEPAVGKPYQGIVPLDSDHLNEALEHYFEQSEQLGSRFWLACEGGIAAGFMLQQLPTANSGDLDQKQEDWERMNHLASTLKTEELLQLSNATILHRLYHEEHTRVYDPQTVEFRCTCSKQRIGQALTQAGWDELQGLLAENGKVAIDCQFCLQHYSFDADQINELFPEKKLH